MMIRKLLRYIVLLPLCLGFTANAQDWSFDGAPRVVALSDIHGAYTAMVRTLESADVIDASGAWTGGDTHLVIVGDLLDRGPESRAAMDHLMRLEEEAPLAGGRVHVLIGNHEAMNLMGDLRYVASEEYAAFAEDETAEERDAWFARYAERAGEAALVENFRARFDERFPPGYFAHRREFAYSGKYGRWLLQKPVVIVVNGTAFVHGGLSPLLADIGLEGVNRTLYADLIEYVRLNEELIEAGALLPTDNQFEIESLLAKHTSALDPADPVIAKATRLIELGRSELHASDGPLWYRGNIGCSRLIEEDRMLAALDGMGADRLVVGHTPTPLRRVLQRFDGRLIEVDTGMLASYYQGRGHALILEEDRVVAVNEAGESGEVLEHPRRVGARPDGITSREALERLLADGQVLADMEDMSGRRIVTVGNSNAKADAFFTKRGGKSFYPDVAAYRLDRMLELDMVPVATARKLGREDGSLMYIAPKSINEEERAASGGGGSATCPIPDQWPAMYTFDVLVYNEGRTTNRMLYSTDNWQLMLVGFERAFPTKTGRPAHLETLELELNPAWRRALESLSEANLATELDGVLDKRRQKALLKRRDQMLETFQ
jgi:hypothetical protein